MVGSLAPSYARLNSQKQLCERLAYLTRFSSLFAFVSGGEGAGKTAIIQQYLELQPDANQALISCNSGSSADTLRQQIISQLYPSATFDPQMPLGESLNSSACLQAPSQNLLLAIDDAHLLPDTILSELWQLQLNNRNAGYPCQINVLLFALPEWCNQSYKLLKAQGSEAPVELDIPALDSGDALAMSKYHLALAGLSEEHMSAELKAITADEHSSPSAILSRLFPEQAEQNTEKTSALMLALKKRLSTLNPKVLAVSLFIILFVTINGIYQQQSTNSNTKAIALDLRLEPEEPASPAVSHSTSSNQLVSSWPSNKEEEPQGPENKASSKPTTLPKPLTSSALELTSNPIKGERVIVTDKQVNDLMAQEKKAKPTEQQAASPTLSNTNATTNKAQLQPVSSTKPSTNTDSEKHTSSKATPETKVKPPLTELDAKIASHYTIQLAGLSSQNKMQRFLQEHQLQNKAWHYQSQHNNKPWFVVIMGDYASIEESRNAIAQLPLSLRSLSPWSKSFGAVQKEIKSAKIGKQ